MRARKIQGTLWNALRSRGEEGGRRSALPGAAKSPARVESDVAEDGWRRGRTPKDGGERKDKRGEKACALESGGVRW